MDSCFDGGEAYDLITSTDYDAAVFEELFIVASVSFAEGEELAATVSKTEAEKCPRCWNHRALGGNANHGSVCERCGDALDAIGFAEGE